MPIVNDPWRNSVVASIGEWPWKGLYALVFIVGFALIVWGWLARHGPVVVYTPAGWLRLAAMVLLVPVFPLLLAPTCLDACKPPPNT